MAKDRPCDLAGAIEVILFICRVKGHQRCNATIVIGRCIYDDEKDEEESTGHRRLPEDLEEDKHCYLCGETLK